MYDSNMWKADPSENCYLNFKELPTFKKKILPKSHLKKKLPLKLPKT